MTPDDRQRVESKTDSDIAADCAADPDACPPMTAEQLARVRRVSPARLIRQKLAMTRDSFAAAYGIPLDTLLSWERRQAEPSAVELAYLHAIEREPERNRLVPV